MSEPAKGEGLLLSGVAGAVDGMGYVLLHVFTAHITGNTVHVGTAVGRLDPGAAWGPAFAIAMFVAGVAGGVLVREVSERVGLPARLAVLGLAGLLLAVFLAVGLGGAGVTESGARFAALAAPAALAMGCQNAVMPKVGGRRVRTYITGTMTELAEALVAAVIRSGPQRSEALRNAIELFAVWLTYLAGGVVSGAAGTRWGVAAALFPLAGIAIAIAVEVRLWRTSAAVGARTLT